MADLGVILRTDQGIWRVVSVDGTTMTLHLYKKPKQVVKENKDG